MTAKLEWTRDKNGWWHAPNSKGGHWSIAVDVGGRFSVAGVSDEWETLADAKAWCEQQEREAAPPVELPEAGDVYEVPGRKETRRMFGGLDHDGYFVKWYGPHSRGVDSVEGWQSWLQSSGAVRIDGSQASLPLAQRSEEITKQDAALLGEAARRIKAEARVLELEGENVRLRERVTETEQECLVLLGQRNGARAAVGRLLEALRRIEDRYMGECPITGYWSIRKAAREAIQREEGVKS